MQKILILLPTCNLLENSDNYSMATGSLWNNHRDKVKYEVNENNSGSNYKINNDKTTSIFL